MVTKIEATEQEILEAWLEAKPIKGKNPEMWREDEDGNMIRFTDYEKSTKFSWQIN
jgi:hypothetical protein